jgi:hypothetical protein
VSNAFYAPGESARREGQRPLRPHRPPLRPVERPPELRPAPKLETPRRELAAVKPGPARSISAAAPATSPSPSRGAARKPPAWISARKCWKSPRRQRQPERKPQIQIQNPKFIQGDAQQLPFPENSFDIVTVGYGLRNLTSWERGWTKCSAWPGPARGSSCWILASRRTRSGAKIYFTHLKMSVPLIGLLFCGNASAYAYILESLKHYPAQLAVAEKMRQLKLANVRVINLLGGAMAINYGEKPVFFTSARACFTKASIWFFPVVVVGVVVEEDEFFHAGLERERHGIVHAAVAPAGVLFVFRRSYCESRISTSASRMKSSISRSSPPGAARCRGKNRRCRPGENSR